MPRKRSIAVALGAGGAKGNAHLGVLRVLESAGYHVASLAGTSAGGLVGSLYAAGYSVDEIIHEFCAVDQQSLFGRRPQDGPSLLGISGVYGVLERLLGERQFEDLKIPFAVIATELEHGHEVVLKKGRVLGAVLATIAIPGVLPPQSWGEYTLVDGGVLDPVPVSVARSLAPHLPVVAVVLSPEPTKATHTPDPDLLPVPAPIARRLLRLRLSQSLQVFMQSIDIGSHAITELRLALDQPDVIIRPDLGRVPMIEPVDVLELVRKGEGAAALSLPALDEAFRWRRLARRRTKYPHSPGPMIEG
jgi:NTE family protein